MMYINLIMSLDICGSCIEHTIHLMACHFTCALSIPALNKTKQRLHAQSINNTEDDDVDDESDDLDVDVSMDIEATENDADAILAASITDFEAGDVVGKLMAFIAQICSCAEDTRGYLMELCATNGCIKWEIKLWVRTRWGSLSDCFAVTLSIQKVCIIFVHVLGSDAVLLRP
jgi:hypothetical protein